MEKKLKSIMADIFVCNEKDINENTIKDDLENWDSLQHLIFVSKLEQEFDVKFKPEEINSMKSYISVLEIIKSKL